jgi:sirohydrochlorin cobaltochelatase
MTGLILRRAASEVAPGMDPADTTLIITGHGTGLNQNSTKAIRDQAELIAASGAGYAAVLDAYMEEQPFIAEWDKMSHDAERHRRAVFHLGRLAFVPGYSRAARHRK